MTKCLNDSMTKSDSRGFAFRLWRVFCFQQILQLRHKLLYVFEIEIYGSEPYISNLVVAAEPVHDQLADFARLTLAFSRFDDEGFGFIDDLLELADRHWALLAGVHQAVENFLAVKTLAAPIFLYHHVGNFVDALIGGEALFAFQAFAAAADGIRFL